MFAYVLAMTMFCLCFAYVLPMFYLYISPNFCASVARASAQSDSPRTSIGGCLCGIPESLPAASSGDGFPHREGRFDGDGTRVSGSGFSP